MRYFTFLCTVLLAGISTAACGGDATGLFGNSSNPTAGAGSGSGAAGQGGATSSGDSASSGSATTLSGTAATSSSSGMGGAGTGGGTGQGGTGATSSSSSATAGTGQGGGPTVDPVGCSDGTREYFTDMSAQGKIAGCAGGWSIEGVTTMGSMQPACNRVAGNSSSNPNGMGCNVEDLCAQGWHVCHGVMDVQAHSATGQCDPFADPNAPQIFITRQVQDSNADCSAPPDTNNITGCGAAIGQAAAGSCNPLNRYMRNYDCYPDPVWYCGSLSSGGTIEATLARKSGPERGGVLCCTD